MMTTTRFEGTAPSKHVTKMAGSLWKKVDRLHRDHRRPSAASISPELRTPPTRIMTERTGKAYLVIGGFGFLGSHIVEGLLARGESNITIFDLAPRPLFAPEQAAGKVRYYRGDITNAEQVARACQGIDTVFHTAAMVNYWARLDFEYEPLFAVNVKGTQNVIDGCVAAGVKQLLFVSSSTVTVNHDILQAPLINADEEHPYARPPYLCHYIATKILAEQRVLMASGTPHLRRPSEDRQNAGESGQLLTAAIRVGGLFGPRDQLLSRMIAKNTPNLCTPKNIIDFIYVENVVHALLGLDRSLQPNSKVAGSAYFIVQMECMPSVVEFHAQFRSLWGHKSRIMPTRPLAWAASLSEAVAKFSQGKLTRYLGPLGQLRPATLTLARATYTFSAAKAARDFGYAAPYSLAEGMRLSYEYWQAVDRLR